MDYSHFKQYNDPIMKRNTFYIILLALFTSLAAKGQETLYGNPVAMADLPEGLSPEKTYLHTDRDVYAPGDTVWLKAYLVDAGFNMPCNTSNNLYTELIGPAGELIARHTLFIKNGFAHGDFTLGDTLGNGQYRLRAYTRFMRNFGEMLFFTKNIQVGSP